MLGLFQCHQFIILPRTTATDIKDVCEAILEWERKSGIPNDAQIPN
jgi:hypothetical protein